MSTKTESNRSKPYRLGHSHRTQYGAELMDSLVAGGTRRRGEIRDSGQDFMTVATNETYVERVRQPLVRMSVKNYALTKPLA